MKIKGHRQTITVSIVDKIYIDENEAAFLRKMAQWCIDTEMGGSLACERLIKILDATNIPEYHGGPVYGIFEAE